MGKIINWATSTAKPAVEQFLKWIVRSVFELAKLIGLAYIVMQFIEAQPIIEIAITSIVVFAAVYFTSRHWK